MRRTGTYRLRGGRPHHFPLVQDQGSPHSIILVVNEEFALVAGEGPHGQQELGQVVAVQRAGLCGQPAGQIRIPYTGHSLHATTVMAVLS